MSVSYIPERVKIRLWGKAAGRCQYEGCNKPLWLDELTQEEFNSAYIAHIIADEPGGPRGDEVLSKLLKDNISNLMLMCDTHHRLIDREDVEGHPVIRLRSMKASHEARIEIVGGIDANKSSHLLLYGANIGQQACPLSFNDCALALPPVRYPASLHPINIGLHNSIFEDRDETFWRVETEQVRIKLNTQLRPRIHSGEIKHLSVFALAPQPLLVLLGTELSELIDCEVFQRRKEPAASWAWEDQPATVGYRVEEPPEDCGTVPALVFALSGTVEDGRIRRVLGESAAIWRVTIDAPNNDFLRSRSQVAEFKNLVRPLLNSIKARHGDQAVLHVFPAMPVSLAVEFGRTVNLKADLPMTLYDEQKAQGGFVKAIQIGTHPA